MGVLYKSIKRGQITKEDAFARELERDEGRSFRALVVSYDLQSLILFLAPAALRH